MRTWNWRAITVILAMMVVILVTGCGGDRTPKPVPWDGSEKQAVVSTKSVPWDGPEKQAVFSWDMAHCSTSPAAKARSLPGWIGMKNGGTAEAYSSANQVLAVTGDMVDTGYRHGQLMLLKPKGAQREVYVGRMSGDKWPTEVVVYPYTGGCD